MYLYTNRMISDSRETIIDMGMYKPPYVRWYHKHNNRHGYLYTTSIFCEYQRTINNMGICIHPECSLMSQRKLSTRMSIYIQNILWQHKENNRHGSVYTTSMYSDMTKISKIVYVISENFLVVYRYPCRLWPLWYQRTYWLYIDNHVDYCLCDIREHTGCI